jgi:hypothetical protein
MTPQEKRTRRRKNNLGKHLSTIFKHLSNRSHPDDA